MVFPCHNLKHNVMVFQVVTKNLISFEAQCKKIILKYTIYKTWLNKLVLFFNVSIVAEFLNREMKN